MFAMCVGIVYNNAAQTIQLIYDNDVDNLVGLISFFYRLIILKIR